VSNFLQNQKAIIGMIHVDPLPGTPRFNSSPAPEEFRSDS
jgi:predicted TIM-barrel enzyme